MIETQAVPTVTFCTQPFQKLVQSRLESLAFPDLPVVLLPHPIITRTEEEIDKLAHDTIDEVVRKLGSGGAQ